MKVKDKAGNVIEIGDTVRCDDFSGKVKEIQMADYAYNPTMIKVGRHWVYPENVKIISKRRSADGNFY